MQTSPYFLSGSHPDAVGISLRIPYWYQGRTYQALAPTPEILHMWHRDKNELLYVTMFRAHVLDKLDPKKVWEELGEKAILCCYEPGPLFNKEGVLVRDGVFCHRHLVADWFTKHLGVTITEVRTKYRRPPKTPQEQQLEIEDMREKITQIRKELPAPPKRSPRV